MKVTFILYTSKGNVIFFRRSLYLYRSLKSEEKSISKFYQVHAFFALKGKSRKKKYRIQICQCRGKTHIKKCVFLVVGPLRLYPPYTTGLVVHATFFCFSGPTTKKSRLDVWFLRKVK